METENRHRVRAIASCVAREIILDRFSDLPDQIAHHILSFLALPDIGRLCCVSTRSRVLCLSTPSLNFDEFSPVSKSTCYRRLRLLTYLDRFLFHRGDNKIQSLLVRWERHYHDDVNPCICDTEYYRINTWIKNAVRCNVEVLDLELMLYSTQEVLFPSCVFLCASLRSLVLDMKYTLISTPSLAYSSNLKYLKLTNAYIRDEGFFNWISHSCKCIEDLHLGYVLGVENIIIEHSSLKRFSFRGGIQICHINISGDKLVDIHLCWISDSPTNKFLTICAPNLISLKLMGNLMSHQNLGKLDCLQTASLFLEPVHEVDKVYELLCSLRRARHLVLNEAAIKASFRDGCVPAPLNDASHLHMDIGSFSDELVPALVSLLRGIPNLSSLWINFKPSQPGFESNTFGFSMEFWKMQDLAFVNQLKDVSLVLSTESNGIELAKYILKYAQNMQEMVVISLPQHLKEVRQKIIKGNQDKFQCLTYFPHNEKVKLKKYAGLIFSKVYL